KRTTKLSVNGIRIQATDQHNSSGNTITSQRFAVRQQRRRRASSRGGRRFLMSDPHQDPRRSPPPQYDRPHPTPSSPPGPSQGTTSAELTSTPASASTSASFTRRPDFRSTNRTGGPSFPVTAHLSPICTSAWARSAVSLPFRVRTYSYRSGLNW